MWPVYFFLLFFPALSNALNFGGRVIDGQNATLGQFPYHVGVVGFNNTDPILGEVLCNGAIIAPNWVLTVAACVYNVDVAGIHAGSINNDGNDGVALLVNEILVHGDFDDITLRHNIALLKLSEELEFTDDIGSVALADSDLEAGVRATVTGFGHSNSDDAPNETFALQWGEITTIANGECADVYGEEIVTENVVCTVAEPASPCYGDAGGPLVQDSEGMLALVGIFSFISALDCEGYPAGYTRISSYRDWIIENTGM